MAYNLPAAVATATAALSTTINALRSSLKAVAEEWPSCRASGTSVTIGSGSFTAVDLTDTENHDIAGMHSTTSSPSVFTVPTGEGGVYLVAAGVSYADDGDTTLRHSRILHNGSTVLAQENDAAFNGATTNHALPAGSVLLAAGDTLAVQARQDTGGDLVVSAWLSATKIRKA